MHIHIRFYLGSWPQYLSRVCLVKPQLPVPCADGERAEGIVRKDLHDQLKHRITKVSLFPFVEHSLPSAQYGDHCHQPKHLVKESQRNRRILQLTLYASQGHMKVFPSTEIGAE
jgi:hypothetical protein